MQFGLLTKKFKLCYFIDFGVSYDRFSKSTIQYIQIFYLLSQKLFFYAQTPCCQGRASSSHEELIISLFFMLLMSGLDGMKEWFQNVLHSN